MSEQDNKLLKLVNSAGFLFQLRIQEEIERIPGRYRKSVLAREYRWNDLETGHEGFIDLVIAVGTNSKMVVECKRVRDAEWIFLVPSRAEETRRTRVLWTKKNDETRQCAAWDQLALTPQSLESEFCIVRGQSGDQQPMLERLSSIVVRSAEALASEELNYGESMELQFYFPVIITTASLRVCRFQSSDIDLLSGELGDADFEEVPFIRFTKSLSSTLSNSRLPSKLSDSARENQRTVFVVNANKLSDVLMKNWEIKAPIMGEPWPWELPVWTAQE